MKKLALFTGALLALTVALSSCGGEKKQDKVLRHVVMFGFKPEVTAEQVKAVEDAFGELPSKIDLIKDYEWGTDCSPEGLQQGLTHCFFVTFHS
ncbi:MAG: Dabb family protein, partial [Parabacteroides sp.]|nr:Dabb family protein [Parabacteroides sp.]